MGQGIFPFLVDLNLVRGVWGSSDFELLESLWTELEEGDEDSVESDDEPTLHRALEEIVLGKVDQVAAAKFGHQYRNATEWICRHFEEELPFPNVLERYGWTSFTRSFEATLAKMGMPKALTPTGLCNTDEPPYPFPPWQDFPFVACIEPIRARLALQRLKPIEKWPSEEIKTVMPQYLAWFTTAVTKDRGLVTFYT